MGWLFAAYMVLHKISQLQVILHEQIWLTQKLVLSEFTFC